MTRALLAEHFQLRKRLKSTTGKSIAENKVKKKQELCFRPKKLFVPGTESRISSTSSKKQDNSSRIDKKYKRPGMTAVQMEGNFKKTRECSLFPPNNRRLLKRIENWPRANISLLTAISNFLRDAHPNVTFFRFRIEKVRLFHFSARSTRKQSTLKDLRKLKTFWRDFVKVYNPVPPAEKNQRKLSPTRRKSRLRVKDEIWKK